MERTRLQVRIAKSLAHPDDPNRRIRSLSPHPVTEITRSEWGRKQQRGVSKAMESIDNESKKSGSKRDATARQKRGILGPDGDRKAKNVLLQPSSAHGSTPDGSPALSTTSEPINLAVNMPSDWKNQENNERVPRYSPLPATLDRASSSSSSHSRSPSDTNEYWLSPDQSGNSLSSANSLEASGKGSHQEKAAAQAKTDAISTSKRPGSAVHAKDSAEQSTTRKLRRSQLPVLEPHPEEGFASWAPFGKYPLVDDTMAELYPDATPRGENLPSFVWPSLPPASETDEWPQDHREAVWRALVSLILSSRKVLRAGEVKYRVWWCLDPRPDAHRDYHLDWLLDLGLGPQVEDLLSRLFSRRPYMAPSWWEDRMNHRIERFQGYQDDIDLAEANLRSWPGMLPQPFPCFRAPPRLKEPRKQLTPGRRHRYQGSQQNELRRVHQRSLPYSLSRRHSAPNTVHYHSQPMGSFDPHGQDNGMEAVRAHTQSA